MCQSMTVQFYKEIVLWPNLYPLKLHKSKWECAYNSYVCVFGYRSTLCIHLNWMYRTNITLLLGVYHAFALRIHGNCGNINDSVRIQILSQLELVDIVRFLVSFARVKPTSLFTHFNSAVYQNKHTAGWRVSYRAMPLTRCSTSKLNCERERNKKNKKQNQIPILLNRFLIIAFTPLITYYCRIYHQL